jgi:hypothetical protein
LVHRISIGKTQESTILWNGYCRAVWFIGNHQRKGKGIFPMVQLSQEKCRKEASTPTSLFSWKKRRIEANDWLRRENKEGSREAKKWCQALVRGVKF